MTRKQDDYPAFILLRNHEVLSIPLKKNVIRIIIRRKDNENNQI